MLSLIEIIFSLFRISGFSLINHPEGSKNIKLTRFSNVTVQIGNFLILVLVYAAGVYYLPQVRILSFSDVSDLHPMIVFHNNFIICFVILCESRVYSVANNDFMRFFHINRMWLMTQKCAGFYEKITKKISFHYFSIIFLFSINEIIHLVIKYLTNENVLYFCFLALPRVLITLRFIQLIFYMRLILLQEQTMLELVRIEKSRIIMKFYVTFLSQIRTKLYFMSALISKYFGWSFAFIAFLTLLQFSYILYVCVLHFVYDEYSNISLCKCIK